jgi:hypothetical protein
MEKQKREMVKYDEMDKENNGGFYFPKYRVCWCDGTRISTRRSILCKQI